MSVTVAALIGAGVVLAMTAWFVGVHVVSERGGGEARRVNVPLAIVGWLVWATVGAGGVWLVATKVGRTPPVFAGVFVKNAVVTALVAVGVLFVVPAIAYVVRGAAEDRPRRVTVVARVVMPWLLVVGLGVLIGNGMVRYIDAARGGETIVWRTPNVRWLAVAAVLAGVLAFHVGRRRAAVMGFSQTKLVSTRGLAAWLSDLPGALRVLALLALVVALMRPETFRTVRHEEDTVDIMIVFDMSKSMEETDLPRDRMDAAQRVVRRFLRRTKHDRVGLVVFGQQAMLQCPLTQDTKLVEQIVRDLVIGDVPALGTAIGDGLALALAQLRRSDGTCDPNGVTSTCAEGFTCSSEGYCQGKKNKVVILLSDGDSNWVTRFEPDEAARTAAKMGVKVYTVLVGREDGGWFGGMSVNPTTLRSIATLTGGEFFRATDYASFDRGFQHVRNQLDKIKRVRLERIPDKQLFLPFAILAAILLALDLALSHTRLRRLP